MDSKKIDRNKIRKAIEKSVPLSFVTYTLPHTTEVFLEEILTAFLEEMGQVELTDKLVYCMKELTINAKKANTKRVYFEEKGLDILDSDDYETGMSKFKEETFSNIDYYLSRQKEKGLYIKISFFVSQRQFTLSVLNNVEITKKEQMRVYDRIARSRVFNTMEEAFAEVLDDTEGAGLGIVIMILMLKNLGLSEDSYEIEGGDGITRAALTIPMSEIHQGNLDMLTGKIVDEIDELPHFPENIMKLQELLKDPDCSIQKVAKYVGMDPALTMDLLKQVNSAQFMLRKRVDSIVEAIKILGLRGLQSQLYSYGAEKVLNLKVDRELWEHSHKVAFYAYSFARNLPNYREYVDDTYVGGVLHDIGKIIFATIHPNLLDKINSFARQREIPSSLFENMAGGYNHAEIGAKIAEKWNFPPVLVAAIQYHHEPHGCPKEFFPVVYSIYLADAICSLEKGDITFEQINSVVLRFFGIKSLEHMMQIKEKLTSNFEKEFNSN